MSETICKSKLSVGVNVNVNGCMWAYICTLSFCHYSNNIKKKFHLTLLIGPDDGNMELTVVSEA